MIKNITDRLRSNPSYFRWGNKRLASYFGCSERTIVSIKNKLHKCNQAYERSLSN